MGCTTSDNEWASSILVRNLTDTKKQKIKDAIELNDLIELALLMEKYQAYPNSEISQPQKGWMLVHLCCRWDSDFCLEYLLKLYFFQNPKAYINFVNIQTVEGYTCLHLCCIWNSVKCVKVLNSFGGLYLKIRDKKLKTPYQNALQYKCSQISALLKQYQNLNVEFVYIQVERMLQNPLIPAEYDEDNYRLEFQKYYLDIKRELYLKNFQENTTTQIELKLLEQKSQIQSELDKLLQEKLKRQLDYDLKRSLILVYISVQELQKQQFLKNEKQKLVQQLQKQKLNMQNQIYEKDESLKLIYQEIRKFQIQRFQKIKVSSYARNEQKFANFNLEMTNKLKELYKNLQFYKRTGNRYSKGRQTMTVSKRSNNNNQVSNKQLSKLPKQIVKLYMEAKDHGYFVDKQFPAENQSIGEVEKKKYSLFTSDTVWLRPKQFFKSDFQLFDGIDPDDIKQGSLGVCYMLATLSALAANPKNIRQIFQFYDLDIGFYVLKLFVNGIPKYFVVDDLIPCCKTTKSPLFTQPIGKQIWVLLLQKAWVKLIGNYLSAESMTADHVMQDLSGAPGYGWWLTKQKLKTPTQKIKQIAKHCSLGHIVVLTSSDKDIQGIVKNHAYSLLSVVQYNNRYIFKIRNPWGCFQWNGQFGQKSSLCTEQFKKKVRYEYKQKGVFYISQNQLLKAFCFYSISHIKPEYIYSYSQFKSKKWENVYYKFKLTKNGQINIRVTQPFDRMIKDKQYEYSPMIFQIGKIIGGNQVSFISEGHPRTYFGAKSVHAFQDIFQNLDKGQYFIRIRMIWVKEAKFSSAVLGVYASQPIVLQRLEQSKGFQLLRGLFISFSKTFIRNTAPNGFYRICTMKGQFLFIGETDQQGEFKVNFRFMKQKMIRTETDIGKINLNQLEVIVNKQKPGVCSAMRTDPSQGGTTGPVSITITRIIK